jgi:epoxyqueuosine reductase
MEPLALTQHVHQVAHELGFHLFGVAPAGPSPFFRRFENWLVAGYDGDMAYLARRAQERADPRQLVPEARSVVVLGFSYYTQDLPAPLLADPSRGLVASYAWRGDYHAPLKDLLFQLDSALRKASGRSTPGRAYVDTGPVLERSWATAAGLGFIGKNTCLISPGLGSWSFLAVLLVPEEMVYDPPVRPAGDDWRSADASRPLVGTCGACTRCLDVCPTQAFPEPFVLDARRCISYLTIELRGPIPRHLRPMMGNWIFGCDLCQSVCPWNRRFARISSSQSQLPEPDMAAPQLLDLLVLDDNGFRERFRGSAIKRAKRRGLLRNACVAAGNWGDPVVVPALTALLDDDEPLIRGHAAWALGQIATSDAQESLRERLATEPHAYVAGEIAEALKP